MEKSLSDWRLEIQNNKRALTDFYESMLSQKPSNYMRLYRAVQLYGDFIVFDAILDSSNRELTGDVLPYVLKVSHEKWKSDQQAKDADVTAAANIERAKKITSTKNAKLAERVAGTAKRAGRKRRVNGSTDSFQ